MRIAITGGIGAGKSTVHRELLKRLTGYVGVSVDDIISDIYKAMRDDHPAYASLKDTLVTTFGTANKADLMYQTLRDPEKLTTLEALFAPHAQQALANACLPENVLVEFPLLVEKDYAKAFDYMINIEVPAQDRYHRVHDRRDMNHDKFNFILGKQATDAQRRRACTVTVVNDVLEETVDLIETLIKTRGKKIGIVSGSFDPITNGHTHLIYQGLRLLDHVVVVIANNPTKKGMFSFKERKQLVIDAIKERLDPNMEKVSVIALPQDEMVVNVARHLRAFYIIRGLRNGTDFEYERQIDLVQAKIAPEVETVYFMTPRELTEVSSSMVKSLLGLKGWEKVAEPYVPECVLAALKAGA